MSADRHSLCCRSDQREAESKLQGGKRVGQKRENKDLLFYISIDRDDVDTKVG